MFSANPISWLVFSFCSVMLASGVISRPPARAQTRPRSVASGHAQMPDLGPGASLHGKQLFPPDSPWNQDISGAPVDSNSANLIASMGSNDVLHPDFGTVWKGAPNGIPYVVVSASQPLVPVNFTAWGAESDAGR